MVLLRMRRLSRVLGALLLLVSLRGLPHLESDDLGCLPVVEEHDHARHAVRPAGAAASEHCDVCHLTRSLRAPGPATAASIAQLAPLPAARPDARELPRAPVLEHLPARAPPATL